MKLIPILIAASIVFVSPSAARAQDGSPTPAEPPPKGSSSIEGVVLDKGGVPLEGAEVKAFLYGAGEKRKFFNLTETTGSNGAYVFSDLPSAKVNLSVQADGFVKLKRETITLGEGERLTAVDFTLAPELTISGSVMDLNGEPLKGATVSATPEYEEGTQKPVIQQETVFSPSGEDGSYTVHALGEWSYTVKAQHKNYVAEAVAHVPAGSASIDFTLREGGLLSGTVRDQVSGIPIPKASVSIKAEGDSSRSKWVQTDENGFYEVSNLQTGVYLVQVTVEGYMDAERPGVSVGEGKATQGVDFGLSPKPRIRGTVSVEGGGPARGAELYLDSAPSAGFLTHFSYSRKADATADELGRYEIIKGVPGKKYVVTARLPGYTVEVSEPFQLIPDRNKEGIDLVLTRGLSISGRVTDDAGSPIPHARVRAVKKGEIGFLSFDPDFSFTGGLGATLTDESGAFTLDGLEPGSYTLKASARGFSTEESEEVELSENSEPGPITIVLQPGLTITGRVTDSSGKPLPGVRVSAWGRGKGGYSSRSAETDAGGRYEIGSLSPGSYRVKTRLKGYAREQREDVEPPAKDIDFSLSSGGIIAGCVVEGKSGRPVGKFRYHTDRAPYAERPMVKWGEETFSDDGEFETKPLDPGDYAVVVGAEGFAPGRTEGVAVESGETTQVEIRLGPESSITGEVVAEKTRMPVGGARIALLKGNGDDLFGLSFGDSDLLREPHLSGENGSFRIGSLPEGSFRLKVTHPDFADETKAVTIEKEGDEVRVKIALKKGRAVSGFVLEKQTSAPIPGAKVSLVSGEGEQMIAKIFASLVRGRKGTAVCDSGGRFEIMNVPPGEYRAGAVLDGYAPSDLKRVTVKPDADLSGIELFLSSGARVSGTVRGTDGKPIPDIEVNAVGAGGFKRAHTDKSGRYALDHLRPGSYTIFVAPEMDTRRRASMSKQVSVGSTDDIVLDFTMGGEFTVSGRVVQKGNPVEGVHVRFTREEAGESLTASDRTGEDGSYRVRGLSAGSYELALSKWKAQKGFRYKAPEPVDISGDLSDYAIALPAGSIIGTVSSEKGDPLKGVRVSLKKLDEREREEPVSALEKKMEQRLLSRKTDPAGRVEFTALAAGSYLLEAARKKFGQVTKTVTLDSDESRVETSLTLRPGFALKVKIRAAKPGRTVERAVIRLEDKDGAVIQEEMLASKDGLFTLDDCAAGNYRLKAAAEGLAPGLLESVEVGPGSKRTAEVTLEEGVTLAVSVKDEKGDPLMGATIELRDSSGKRYRSLWFSADRLFQSDLTGSNGQATIEGLPEGSYTVKVRKPGYEPAEAAVTVEKGKEAPASLKLEKKQETNPKKEETSIH